MALKMTLEDTFIATKLKSRIAQVFENALLQLDLCLKLKMI